MRYRLFTINAMIFCLLLISILNSLTKPSELTELVNRLAQAEGSVVQAAEAATGGSVSGDTEGEYLVRIFINGEVVETRYCDYGEKIVLSNYYHNGSIIERWDYDRFYFNEAGNLIETEKVEVINRTLELTIVYDTNIKAYKSIYEPEIRTCDKTYIDRLVNAWEKEGYPDYVGGAYKNDSKWMIYLKGNTTENQEKIKDQVYDWQLITSYLSCTYSYKELSDVKDEIITNYPASTAGIRSISIECQQWPDGVTEPRVLVLMQGIKKYDSLAYQFADKYGSQVMVAVYDKESGFIFPVRAPKQVKVKSAKVQKKKIVIKWKKSDGASKYQIQIFRGKKKVKTISTKKLTCKHSLKKKKSGKYYVKVRAYGKDAQRWGEWSKKVRVK